MSPKPLEHCTKCGAEMHPLLLQSLRELGVPASIVRCDNTFCGELHVVLYDFDFQNVVQIYMSSQDEIASYRRRARAQRLARGER